MFNPQTFQLISRIVQHIQRIRTPPRTLAQTYACMEHWNIRGCIQTVYNHLSRKLLYAYIYKRIGYSHDDNSLGPCLQFNWWATGGRVYGTEDVERKKKVPSKQKQNTRDPIIPLQPLRPPPPFHVITDQFEI